MAWLSGLADKAENLLNKIDKNTAAVLNKDKYDVSQSQLTEVTWVPVMARVEEARYPNANPSYLRSTSSTPDLRSSSPVNVATGREDELLVNQSAVNLSPRRAENETVVPSTPSSLLVEHPTDNTDSVSEFSLHSERSSPGLSHTSVDVVDNDAQERESRVKLESLQQQTTAPVTSNSALDNHATRMVVQNGHVEAQEQSDVQGCENEVKQNGAIEKVDPPGNKHIRKYLREVEKDLKERNVVISKQETDQQKEIAALKEKLRSSETENGQLLRQISDLHVALERSRLELNSTRSELEQHRARALRTLQEKEKLIAELRSNTSTDTDDTTLMELNQLRQERDNLREENQQISGQLRIVREELTNADLKLEKMRQKSTEANLQAQEILATERRRRMDAEEDARLHLDEARSLKDELIRQRSSFTLQLQKQESEISKLKVQLSTVATPSSEVESRLASLTQTLVSKQQALESLTTERNALRLQLEKIEHEYRNSRRNVFYNVNDTDDAKAQVPTFLMETPFDTGVTRRVKRAYSLLDAISIRTGVFLRRYPLARILVLIYMALLQFWVLVVLLSQSPEAH